MSALPNFARARAMLAGAALLLGAALLPSQGVRAEGAMAVGSTGDISKDGLAIGRSRNDPSQEVAERKALQACRDFKDAPQRTRDRCRIVANYKNECAASALDPKAGTPGWGYAIARDSDTAGERALGACKATAGEGREKFCRLDEMVCDGTAK